MSVVLRSSSWVLVQVEGHAPGKMTLAQVREALGSGQLAPSAMVQVAPDVPWRPAREAVAACNDFLPGSAAAPKGRETPWHLLAAVALGTLTVVAGALGGYQFPAAVLLALLVPLLAFWLGGRVLARQRLAAVPFATLPPDARREGLLLAWESGPVAIPTGLRFLIAPYAVAIVGAFSVSQSEGFDAGRAVWSCGVVLLAATVGALSQLFQVAPAIRRGDLRTVAQQWCARWNAAWLERSGAIAGDRAVQRFRLPAETEPYPLFRMRPKRQLDMPPPQVDITILLAGDFLAIREGAVIDVHATSFQQGINDTPETLAEVLVADDDTKVTEREAHYQDLVTVDYERTPGSVAGADGLFRVSLSNGQRFAFHTIEQGVSSALEAVRLRTRAAKLG